MDMVCRQERLGPRHVHSGESVGYRWGEDRVSLGEPVAGGALDGVRGCRS